MLLKFCRIPVIQSIVVVIVNHSTWKPPSLIFVLTQSCYVHVATCTIMHMPHVTPTWHVHMHMHMQGIRGCVFSKWSIQCWAMLPCCHRPLEMPTVRLTFESRQMHVCKLQLHANDNTFKEEMLRTCSIREVHVCMHALVGYSYMHPLPMHVRARIGPK